MTDYYLTDKSRLYGQPKRTIGDYVESQGILVPRRFDTLQEARASTFTSSPMAEKPMSNEYKRKINIP